ncbi:YiiX/YebB-like N1pC/P60 family cysteine hydrolase [Maritimibacter dapengensis]|uniref:Permuted papain-like amidase enzyme, YaeF/YiiX, C92 family n=1 Tax=Maritimibacter dapengensis TaxID=2836868 RepID=A0ABS6SY07_9RHOB|nr:YiiX/YebB-like N1pC/P60 family cysteine hydrolase [Maritimibacter dapengensis]MBV7377848.1 hypothetical protein [Maritimibacter dapengensis]
MSRFHALLGAFLLASCGLPIEHPDFTGLPPTLQAKDFHCCADPDRHPAWFTEVAMTMSEPLEPLFDPGPNSGYLSHDPRAMARIAAQAQPLDMLTLAAKSHLGSRFFSGWFTHTALYLGTEAQLREAGLWTHPSIVPHHAEIRSGKIVIEGVATHVRLATLDEILSQRDAAALIRTNLSTRDKGRAASRALSLLNYPFDYFFDLNTCDAFACTEVLARAFPTLDFPIRTMQGYQVLLPDDVAAKAIRGEQMRIVDYVEGNGTDWHAPGLEGAMYRIAAFWGPAPVGPVAAVTSSLDLAACTPD